MLFRYIELFSTYDTTAFSANFWLPIPNLHLAFTDHRTAMHRQQNPASVPIMELGAFVGLGSDISWGRSDHRNIALLCLHWVSVARRRGRRTRLVGRKTWLMILLCRSLPFHFFISHHYCLSHGSSIPLSTYLLLNFAYTLLLWPHAFCRHIPDIGPYWGPSRLNKLTSPHGESNYFAANIRRQLGTTPAVLPWSSGVVSTVPLCISPTAS